MVRGLDVEKHYLDIKRIILGRVRPHRFGLDPDDVVQQVYHQNLHKNKRKHPFEPDGYLRGRGRMSTYVWQVAISTCLNMSNASKRNPLSKHNRFTNGEVDDEFRMIVQVSGISIPKEVSIFGEIDTWIRARFGYADMRRVVQVGRLLRIGRNMKQISGVLNIPPSQVKKAKVRFEELCRLWKIERENEDK